jgi:hydroxylamine oxidation protein HaoB
VALALLVGGAGLLLWPLVAPDGEDGAAPAVPTLEVLAEESPPGGRLAGLATHYPVERLTRFEARWGSHTLPMVVAHYCDAAGQKRRALLPPLGLAAGQTPGQAPRGTPAGKGGEKPGAALGGGQPGAVPGEDADPRLAAWARVARIVPAHTGAGDRFLAWWDNAGRIRLLTGRDAGPDLPSAPAFSTPALAQMWGDLAGGLILGPSPDTEVRVTARSPAPARATSSDLAQARELARWLTADTAQVFQEWRQRFPPGGPGAPGQPLHVLVTVDDLARLAELEALGGRHLGAEATRFPLGGDLHGQILAVKRWAAEPPGIGSYLVTRRRDAVIAWRLTDATSSDALIVRLLPFTSSLSRPLPNGLALVERSAGAWLSIYTWHPERGNGAAPPPPGRPTTPTTATQNPTP